MVVSASLRAAALGAALGLAWGVTARVWMRMISTDPEFSWAGTLAILGLSGWLGLGVGLASAARRRGRRPWAALLGAPGLALFASPGILFLPAFAVGGLASGQRGRVAQGVGVLAVLGPAVLLWRDAADDPALTPGLLTTLTVGFVLLSALLAAGGSQLWRRSAGPASAQDGPLRADGGVLAVAGVDDRLVG